MALIEGVTKKDEYGREYTLYYDTDDLTQEQFYNYVKLIQEGKCIAAKNYMLECLRRK